MFSLSVSSCSCLLLFACQLLNLLHCNFSICPIRLTFLVLFGKRIWLVLSVFFVVWDVCVMCVVFDAFVMFVAFAVTVLFAMFVLYVVFVLFVRFGLFCLCQSCLLLCCLVLLWFPFTPSRSIESFCGKIVLS